MSNVPGISRRGRLLSQRWQPRAGAPGGRRSRQAFTYDAFLPTRIGEEEFALTSTIAAANAAAESAVQKLNREGLEVPNLEALARQLLRAECVASSRIEGLILGHRRLAHAAFDPTGRDLTATAVLANIAALEDAIRVADRACALSVADIVTLHRTLFAGTRHERLGGVIREEQNWIGGAATDPRRAEFVPPPHEHVAKLLDDLCVFINRSDVPTVIQAAIAHAQFETIHPFHDGNGRVGRALIALILRRRNLAPRTLPPVSLVLAGRARAYIAGLTSFRAADEEDWYAVFIDAVRTAASGATGFDRQVTNLQRRWLEQSGRPRAGSGAARLIGLLPGAPVLDVATATTLLGGSNERARLAIIRLEQADILRPTTIARRNRVWETVGLFDLLDRFERELGAPDRTPIPTQDRGSLSPS